MSEGVAQGGDDEHIILCDGCGCQMDITSMEPYTKVICPDCGHQMRVKCELGQYVLTGRHAVGGMSKVFRAQDSILDREVAIKILNDDYSKDEQRMHQFEREALITAAISHPHVVRVFTVGKAYGHFYIAMEMVAGENLEQRIGRDGAISEDKLLPIAAEIISGLQAAKKAGLIHRDMKPGNILFDVEGHVKIVDFGLALVTQGGSAKADEVWATPFYVPPEALDGREEDFRSDMYALGATLYHALSGTPPIDRDATSSRDVLKAKEKITPLIKVAPWLKAETCYFVEQAMAFKPADRFDSYAEMEVARAQAYSITEKRGAAVPMHKRERARRRFKEKLVMGGLVAGIIVGLILFFWLAIKKRESEFEQLNKQGIVYPAAELFKVDRRDYSPEVAERIGKQFRLSHKMLGDGRYRMAQSVLMELMQDKEIVEPAASWAGAEAVIAAWLSGDSADAMRVVSELHQHIERRGDSGDVRLRQLVEKLAAPAMITDSDPGKDALKVVYMTAVALKNWEMGSWEHALPLFEKIRDQKMPKQSPLAVYPDIADRYLHDYWKLKPASKVVLTGDVKQVQGYLDSLSSVRAKLKTKGRAKFVVGVWQLRAERHLIRLEKERLAEAARKKQQEKPAPPTFEQQLAKSKQLLKSAKFAEAVALLRQASPAKQQQGERDAWVYLATSANAFITELEQGVFDQSVVMDLRSLEGHTFSGVLAAKPGGLMLLKGEGEVFVPWSQMEPASVLDLYRQVFKLSMDTLQGRKHSEHAVCYAWIAGMQDKAQLAAGKLSEVDPNFKKRWHDTMHAYGQ